MCHDGFLSDRNVGKNFAVGTSTGYIYRVTHFRSKYAMEHLALGFRCRTPQNIKLFKGPGNTFPINKKFADVYFTGGA